MLRWPGERGWELGLDEDVTGEVGLRDFINIDKTVIDWVLVAAALED